MQYVLKKPIWTIPVVACIVAALFFVIFMRTPNGDLTVEQKVADFEYLYQTMRDNYALFDVVKRKTGLDWLSKHDTYLARVKRTRNDTQFIRVMTSIIGELKQGHTNILTDSFYNAMVRAYQSADPRYNMKPWLDVLTNPKVIARYARLNDRTSTNQGTTMTAPSGLKTEIIEAGSIGYLSVKSFNNLNVEADRPQLDGFVQSVKDFPYLIIDIRGNSGGSDLYWLDGILRRLITEPFQFTRYSVLKGGDLTRRFSPEARWEPIDTMPSSMISPELLTSFSHCIKRNVAITPLDPVGFRGKVFLLVDQHVTSSSENLAFYSKSIGWATLVGTNTRGDGGGTDSALFSLPESGLVVRCRVEMGLNPDGTSNVEYGMKPDVEIGKREDALQVALKMIRGAATP